MEISPVPNPDLYRSQELIDLKRDCASRAVYILNNFPNRTTIITPIYEYDFQYSDIVEAEDEAVLDEGGQDQFVRIAQPATVQVGREYSLDKGHTVYADTASEEYYVFTLQSGSWNLDEEADPDELEWKNSVSIVIKPEDDENPTSIDILDHETGRPLNEEELLNLSSLLSAMDESLRMDVFSSTLRGHAITRPEITPKGERYRNFMASEFIDGVSCLECGTDTICFHDNASHNLN